MLYRRMPGDNDSLSILGFGCMRLPINGDCSVNESLTAEIIRRAIDRGVNYLDTAYPYHNGESEAVLGRILKEGYRERVNLATKLPSWFIKTRQDMDAYLKEQLNRLQTDHIDYYLVHGLNRANWGKLSALGVLEFLDAAKQDGRIRCAGFSFHDDFNTFSEIVDAYNWTFCQIQLNFLDEKYQAGTAGLAYAASKGMGVIAMEPLRGGILAKDLPGLSEIWQGARRPAEMALRWVWNYPEVTLLLSGMNSMQQVEENLKTAEDGLPGSLSDHELALLEKAKSFYRNKLEVNCTGCGYCMPCPSGVDIPECFNQYNNAVAFDEAENAKRVYLMFITGNSRDASRCTECGTCLPSCPQQINIPEMLSKVSNYFQR